MQKIKKTILFILLSLIFGFTSAQTKVAQISSLELISAMPEMKTAKEEYDKLQDSLESEIYGLIITHNELKSKNSNSKKLEEIEKLISEKKLEAQKTLEQKYTELTKPIQDKALSAIKKVGRENGFSFVIDSTDDSIYLMSDGELPDILKLVKKELGINN